MSTFRPGGCTALPAPGIPVALARSPPSTGGAYMGAPNAVGRALPRRRNGTRTSLRRVRPSCAPPSVLSRRCVAHVTTLLNSCLNFFFLFLSYKKKGPRLRAVASVREGGNRTRTCCTCYGAPSALPLSYLPMHGKRRRKVQCAPFGRFPSSLRVPSPSAVRMPTDDDFRHPPSPLCAARSQRPVLGTRVRETTG